jgi:uncharacterized protein (DUF1501 family)
MTDSARNGAAQTGAAMGRRRFLTVTAAATGAVIAGGATWAHLVGDQAQRARSSTTPSPPTTAIHSPTILASTTPAPTSGRILVVVQMGGGNDGLNTVVPVGQGRYHDLRPNIGLADDTLLTLTGLGGSGLHPALAPLASRWDAGHLGILQGVGFPDQGRSHFAAMDTWWAGSSGANRTTGWLGRWLDATGEGANPLRGIALGEGSPALVGETAQATFVSDPALFRLRTPTGVDADALTDAFRSTAAPLAPEPLLAAAQRSVPASFEAVDVLALASGAGGEGSPQATVGFGGRPTATSLLETAAGIVELDVGTQVFVVGVSGFDTHAGQLANHERLLADVARGIDSFLSAMEVLGRADDVLVITTSEFGRRAQDNLSGGCDHGSGGTLFVLGQGVSGRLVGEADLAHLVDGDVAIEVDTRSLYSVALDWLGGPTAEILDGEFDRYELI